MKRFLNFFEAMRAGWNDTGGETEPGKGWNAPGDFRGCGNILVNLKNYETVKRIGNSN